MNKGTIVTAAASASSGLAVSPSDILPDNEDFKVSDSGIKLRKGTIAATFANAKIFENLREGNYSDQELENLRSAQMALIPALEQVGFFAFFGAEDMLEPDPTREGRAWIALLYFSLNPDKLTPDSKLKIVDLGKKASLLLSNEIKALFQT